MSQDGENYSKKANQKKRKKTKVKSAAMVFNFGFTLESPLIIYKPSYPGQNPGPNKSESLEGREREVLFKAPQLLPMSPAMRPLYCMGRAYSRKTELISVTSLLMWGFWREMCWFYFPSSGSLKPPELTVAFPLQSGLNVLELYFSSLTMNNTEVTTVANSHMGSTEKAIVSTAFPQWQKIQGDYSWV